MQTICRWFETPFLSFFEIFQKKFQKSPKITKIPKNGHFSRSKTSKWPVFDHFWWPLFGHFCTGEQAKWVKKVLKIGSKMAQNRVFLVIFSPKWPFLMTSFWAILSFSVTWLARKRCSKSGIFGHFHLKYAIFDHILEDPYFEPFFRSKSWFKPWCLFMISKHRKIGLK